MEGVKNDQGKPRMDLLPPEALISVAQVLTYGANKYAAHNWRKGMDHGRMVAALLRHLAAHQMGTDYDEESGLPHLAHAACNALMLLTSWQTGIGADDRWTGDNDDTQQGANLCHNGSANVENRVGADEVPRSGAEAGRPRAVSAPVGPGKCDRGRF